MKNTVLIILLVININLQAQTEVNLEIRHTLAGVNSVMNTVETNSSGEDFKITRLQYYITRISIIHDGNQTLTVDDSIVALVNVNNELTTTIALGEHNVNSIEGIKFKIGVYSPVNNEDPLQWASNHPFAPQNPSMHWGWASGYRFVAFEGVSGLNFSQLWQFHGLGNNNYFEVNPIMTPSAQVNGVETIKIEADYIQALKNISISQGLISHGTTGAAVTVLQNFKSYVFGIPSTVAIKAQKDEVKFDLSQNPSINGITKLIYSQSFYGKTVRIYNLNGQEISSNILDSNGVQDLNFERKGVFLISVFDKGIAVKTIKLVNI